MVIKTQIRIARNDSPVINCLLAVGLFITHSHSINRFYPNRPDPCHE